MVRLLLFVSEFVACSMVRMALAIVKEEDDWIGSDSSEDDDFNWDKEVTKAVMILGWGKDLPDDRAPRTLTSPVPSRVTRSRTRQLQSLENRIPVPDMQIKTEPLVDGPVDLPLAFPLPNIKRTCETCHHIFSKPENLRRHRVKGCRNMCRKCN